MSKCHIVCDDLSEVAVDVQNEIDEFLEKIDHANRREAECPGRSGVKQKGQAVIPLPARRRERRSDVWLGLAQTRDAVAGFPLAAFL